jgi:carboxyl-terminal processing protease
MNSGKRGPLLVTAVLVGSALLGGLYGTSAKATAAGATDLQDSVKEFTQLLTVVQQNYAIPVDSDKIVYDGAIPGMLRTLDPHSYFLDPKAWAVTREDEEGKYYGVGMQIVQRTPPDNRVEVISPFVGSPAYKAGIRPGDIIVKVDDKSAVGLGSPEIADLLKGPKGTTVRISMQREGEPKPLVFTVQRDEIPHHLVDDPIVLKAGYGYIRLTGFNETTGDDFVAALEEATAAPPNGKGVENGLVIDLRDNPGGVLDSATKVCDSLLDKNQVIVSQRGRSVPQRFYYALHGNGGDRIPIVVLIDSNTASASEIVAGALQDHDRALILGERSFGKGLVQSVQGLSDGTGLALTVAHYYTPSGRLIQRDYKDVSFFDYEYNRQATISQTEVKLTDSGRKVYGGGGILPDVEYPSPKLDDFELMLRNRNIIYLPTQAPFDLGVGDFTTYFLGTKPNITKSFVVDDSVMAMFKEFLKKKGVTFTDQNIADDSLWLKTHIRREVFTSMFGQQEAFRVEMEADPEVARAVDLTSQARQLYETARRITAERAGSSNPGLH